MPDWVLIKQVNCPPFRPASSTFRTLPKKRVLPRVSLRSLARQSRLIIWPNGVHEAAESPVISGVFAHSGPCNPFVPTVTPSEESEPMSAFYREKVVSVRHWTDTLFSFTATRNTGFRFHNGQFAMIGLEVEGRPLVRAYSMASANHEEALEFFSIKVADGPLTSRLQKIREGDILLVGDRK